MIGLAMQPEDMVSLHDVYSTYSTDHKQLNTFSQALAKALWVCGINVRVRERCSQTEIEHARMQMRIQCNNTSSTRTHATCVRGYYYFHLRVCAKISRALAKPMRVARVWALSCLWFVLYSDSAVMQKWTRLLQFQLCSVSHSSFWTNSTDILGHMPNPPVSS